MFFYSYFQTISGDLFGKLLAVISLVPFAIITGFITLILFRRDLHTVSNCIILVNLIYYPHKLYIYIHLSQLQIAFFSGIIINEGINFILKHTIREVRPMKRDSLYTEYGMPSTHAQFMWFFAAYATLFICIR